MNSFFNGVFVCVLLFATLIALTAVAGGSYMCYTSGKYTVCSDWSYSSQYSMHQCDYSYKDAGAILFYEQTHPNNTNVPPCVCYDPITRQPNYPDGMPHSNTSGSLLGGGIAIIVVGVFIIIAVIGFTVFKFKRT